MLFYIGVAGFGLNIASLNSSSDNQGSVESVTGIAIGLSAGVPVAEGWSARLGAAYSQEGFGPVDYVDIVIDYVELAALLGKPLPLGDRASLRLLAGPALSFNLSCRVNFVNSEYEDRACSEVIDDDPYIEAIDLGAVGGIEAGVGLTEGFGLSVGVFYKLGLLNVLAPAGPEEGKFTNRTLALRVGAFFPID